MQHYEIIERLQTTPGRLDKEQIIFEAAMSGHREFFLGARLAFDILVTFGVNKVPAIAEEDLNPDDPGTFGFTDFLALTTSLSNRKLTGNAARDAISAAASRCHGPSWNGFYRRVLMKYLSCGITEGTINKILNKMLIAHPEVGDLLVPVFACQLAIDGQQEVHAKKIHGKKLLDIKLDGVRLLSVLDKESNTVIQYTRNGKRNDNFPNIRLGLESLLRLLPASVVLDGEVVGASFQDLMTQVNRKKPTTDTAKLALFDIIPLEHFRAGRSALTQKVRHAELANLHTSGVLRETSQGAVYVVPKIEVDLDTPEGQTTYAEFNRQALESKFEGIMIKDPGAPYECRRWAAWMKKKPVISVSLEIVGVERGDAEGKNRNVMGALVGKGEDEGRLIECNVGTGFTDVQRADFWRHRDKMIGLIMEVESDTLTLEQGGTVYSLRFPRFKGLRGSVPGEKL